MWGRRAADEPCPSCCAEQGGICGAKRAVFEQEGGDGGAGEEAIGAVPSVAPRAIGGLLEQNQGSRHRPRVLVVLFVAILVSFFVVSKLIKLALILKPLHFSFC